MIKEVQKRAGLKPDGVIGPRTVASLAGTSKADRIDKVVLALEELRWLPSDLGSPRVFINEPAFTASYIEGGEEKLKMNASWSASRPTRPASSTTRSSRSTTIPIGACRSRSWSTRCCRACAAIRAISTAPATRSPTPKAGASRHRRSAGAPTAANIPFAVRQSPSEANALGELKILFPNKHAIYMHDTPQKALFKQDMRAFSHGCVRLEDPRGMAAAVLGTSVDYVAEKLKQGHSVGEGGAQDPGLCRLFHGVADARPARSSISHDIYGRDDYVHGDRQDRSGARAGELSWRLPGHVGLAVLGLL